VHQATIINGIEHEMSTDTHSVEITMSQATVQALANSNAALVGLLGVQTSDAAALPLVWLRTQQYSLHTVVNYTSTFEAYTSLSALAPGGPVRIGFTAPIDIGELLTVSDVRGFGTVTTDAGAGAVAMVNTTNAQFTAGLCEQGDELAAICGQPLYGNGYALITPLPTIFLEFTSVPVQVGTALAASTGPGVLIDQSSSPECSVAFDINGGWSADGQPWIQPLPPRSNLAALLTAQSPALAERSSALAATAVAR
jgi:hypothetical protein